ncbi:Wall-associated receptor kinase, C-terminal [Parasponia andersonii]|uniref:non-specific serine/threonine protein kinase n=1 Tax=Parasponia andersonii TaxID=3476 RepID=A0A2P5BWD9_PARAD|nr:Wall-associated receptor kinase, C-terminal [Parasponia andersonii]
MHFHLRRTIFVLLILLKTTTFAKNRHLDQQYVNCTNKGFDCGKFQNLNYPFWGSNRPQYCGHPEFELRNCGSDAPEIVINSVSYRVLAINTWAYKFTVVRTDYWNDVCPKDLRNGTLYESSSLFSYDSRTQDLILYYRCPTNIGTAVQAGRFSCKEEESTGLTNFFATTTSMSGRLSTTACNQSVTIRISNSAANNLQTNTTPGNLTAAINSGFEIDWDAENSRCELCQWSGGLCGSHNVTKEVTCYCKDRPYLYVCGSNSSGSSSDFTVVNQR